MTSSRPCRFIVLFFVLLILIHAGCARTQPSRFYALTSIPEIAKADPENIKVNGKTIGVGPVEIPSYLDRPQIVTLKGPHQFHMAEFDRWAGTLKDNIGSVIAENLSAMLPGDQVYVFPWRSVKPVQYQITVRIMRFDAVPGDRVNLDARWMILEREGRQRLMEQRSQIRVPFSGKGYDDIVSAQSMALGELSRDIAAAVQALPASSE
jgi:uncharacterized protein